MARQLDGIYIEELRRTGLYETVWQAGVVVAQSVHTYTKGDDAGSGGLYIMHPDAGNEQPLTGDPAGNAAEKGPEKHQNGKNAGHAASEPAFRRGIPHHLVQPLGGSEPLQSRFAEGFLLAEHDRGRMIYSLFLKSGTT